MILTSAMILTILIAIAWLSYLPNMVLFVLGLIRIRRKKKEEHQSLKDPRFIFQITTNGNSPKSTQEAIRSIHSNVHDYPYEVWVVTEPLDKNEYSDAEKIVVPSSYSTKKKAKGKARALQYATELRKKRNLTSDKDWVILLDDDNLFTQDYFDETLKMKSDSVAGQGIITARNEYGSHTFSSLADNTRPSDCISVCSFFNSIGDPMLIHGEGLVVRSDVENEVGWDLDVLIEDFFFGRRIARKYPKKFQWINACVEFKSPLSAVDFLKQRKRWMWGFIRGFSKLSRREKLWSVSRYGTFFLGIISLIGVVISFTGLIHLSRTAMILFSTIAVGFFGHYQVGCYFNTRKLKILRRVKYHLLQLILQWPVAAYELCLIIAGLLRAPKKFEVIKKDQ